MLTFDGVARVEIGTSKGKGALAPVQAFLASVDSAEVASGRRVSEVDREALLQIGSAKRTADNIKAASIAAINNNFTRYTAADGYSPLKKALTRKLVRDNEAH